MAASHAYHLISSVTNLCYHCPDFSGPPAFNPKKRISTVLITVLRKHNPIVFIVTFKETKK